MEGEHSHEMPPVPVVTPIVEKSAELTQPVIDHTEKITRIEERQAQHQQEMLRQLGDLETRLATATSSQVSGIEERMAQLEQKIAAAAQPVAEIPEEGVELVVPDVDASPAPPEKVRQGMNHRRKAKRKAVK